MASEGHLSMVGIEAHLYMDGIRSSYQAKLSYEYSLVLMIDLRETKDDDITLISYLN